MLMKGQLSMLADLITTSILLIQLYLKMSFLMALTNLHKSNIRTVIQILKKQKNQKKTEKFLGLLIYQFKNASLIQRHPKLVHLRNILLYLMRCFPMKMTQMLIMDTDISI